MPDDRLDPPMKPVPTGPLRLPRAGVPNADWRAPAPGSLEEALAAMRPMPEELDDALSRLDAMIDRRFTFTPGPDAVFPPAWGEGDDAKNPDLSPRGEWLRHWFAVGCMIAGAFLVGLALGGLLA